MNNIKDKRMTMKSSSGITLVALAITIIVMMIIATISIYEGTKVIKEAKVQTLETNMLAIKAKAKTYVEEVEAATWALTENKEQIRQNFFKGEIDANGYGMEDDDKQLCLYSYRLEFVHPVSKTKMEFESFPKKFGSWTRFTM